MNPIDAARRNFQLGVINGFVFTISDTLMDPTLVIAAFISHLTSSPLWLGLVIPLSDGGWYLPQLWVSGYLQSQPRKIVLYRYMAVVRIVIWSALSASVFLLKDPRLMLTVFVAAFGLLSLGAGFSGLSFLEIVGKTIPPKQRGLFFAWRLTLGGLAGVGASALVKWLLDETSPVPFPYNFGALFALALLLGASGLIAFAHTDEPPDRNMRPRASFADQLRRAGEILASDSNFRHFLNLRSAILVAGAATPFFAVHVQQQMGGGLGMIGVYLAVLKGVNLAATVLFGRYSAEWGHHRLMTITAAAGLLMTTLVLALALLAQPVGLSGAVPSLWLVPVFALAGIRDAGIGVSAQSLLLDVAPPSERTIYLGFTNTFLGIVLLATGLSGVVAQRFGFVALLVVTLAAYVFALHSAGRLKMSDHPA